jgi:hypothetical protein
MGSSWLRSRDTVPLKHSINKFNHLTYRPVVYEAANDLVIALCLYIEPLEYSVEANASACVLQLMQIKQPPPTAHNHVQQRVLTLLL